MVPELPIKNKSKHMDKGLLVSLLTDRSIWRCYSDPDLHSSLQNLLKKVDSVQINACLPKRGEALKYVKSIIEGGHSIHILPPKENRNKREWSNVRPQLLKIDNSINYLFTKPAQAPGMLNPLLCVYGNMEDSEFIGGRYLYLSLWSYQERHLNHRARLCGAL